MQELPNSRFATYPQSTKSMILHSLGNILGSYHKTKGTQGFIHCSFKVASLATLNKQMLSSVATYDALSLVNHKARLNLVWVQMVYMCTALING